MEGGTDREITKPPDIYVMDGSPVTLLTGPGGISDVAGKSKSGDNVEGGSFVRSQNGDSNGSGVCQYVCGEQGEGDGGTEGDKSQSMKSNTRNKEASPPPSSDENPQLEKAGTSGAQARVKEEVIARCDVLGNKCVTHSCDVKKVKQKVTKWGYINSKKKYGYKYSTVVRHICVSGGQINGTVSGQSLDSLTGGIKAHIGEGRESFEALRLAETKILEQMGDM